MQAGKLRDRVTFQAPGPTQNALGEPINGWADVGTVWAEVTAVKETEAIAAAQVNSELTTRVRVRYPDFTITTQMRVVFGTRYLYVGNVKADQKKAWLDLRCVEKQA